MAKQKDGGRNVADYEQIKNVLFSEYYDLLRLINTLNDYRMHEAKQEYQKTISQIENRLFFLANLGGSSKNISSGVVQKILGTTPSNTKEDEEELDALDLSKYNSRQELLSDLKKLVTLISIDMGETGFLDTRLDEEQVTEISEDLENYYLDRKPAIYDR